MLDTPKAYYESIVSAPMFWGYRGVATEKRDRFCATSVTHCLFIQGYLFIYLAFSVKGHRTTKAVKIFLATSRAKLRHRRCLYYTVQPNALFLLLLIKVKLPLELLSGLPSL